MKFTRALSHTRQAECRPYTRMVDFEILPGVIGSGERSNEHAIRFFLNSETLSTVQTAAPITVCHAEYVKVR